MSAMDQADPSPAELMECAQEEIKKSFPWATADMELDVPSHFWVKPNWKYTKF